MKPPSKKLLLHDLLSGGVWGILVYGSLVDLYHGVKEQVQRRQVAASYSSAQQNESQTPLFHPWFRKGGIEINEGLE